MSNTATDRSTWLSKITHALIAVDGSPTSVRAATVAGNLLGCFPEARLTVLYVAPLPRDLQISGTGSKVVVEFPISSVMRETAGPVLVSLGTSGENTGLGSVTQKVLSRAQCPVLVVS